MSPLVLLTILVACNGETDTDPVSPPDSAPPADTSIDAHTGDSGAPPTETSTPPTTCARSGGVLEESAISLTGAAGDDLGASLAGLGDIDGDGLADLLVGMTGSDVGGPSAGAAWLVRGGVPATAGYVPPMVDQLLGELPGDGFGLVGVGGDIDGDGLADALVGALLDDTASTDAGAAYVLYGHADGLGARPAVKILGENPGDLTGRASTAGDVDGDGLGDVLVASEAANSSSGAAYLVLGSVIGAADGSLSLADAAMATFRPEATGDQLNRIAGGGDIDGDGLDDFAISARGWQSSKGVAYLYLADPALSGELWVGDGGWQAKMGGTTGSLAGHAMSMPGDVDGDGLDDLLVGSPYESTIDYKRGVVYVVTSIPSGDSPLAEAASIRIDGAHAEDRMGYGVDGGDIDADGIADLQLSAKFEETTGVNAGTVYVIGGGLAPGAYIPEPGSALAYHELHAEAERDNLGSVSFVGDTDGNGTGDFALGARFFGADAGSAYLMRCGL